LIDEIRERTIRIQDGLRKEDDRYWDDKLEKDERYNQFLTRVQQIIGRKCLFLRNENKDVIFQKPGRDYYDNAQKRNDSILETYLRYACKGEGQGEVRGTQTRKRNLTQEELKEFETYLNENLPDFEQGMYQCISVERGDDGQPVIYLIEKTGDRVELNETSAGRRWYFTYYFMKNLLDEGDIFIIDEPAATLHPLAQREVMAELTELVKRGIKVVYSTHSPYLIPKEWQSVHCVTMTNEGTKVNDILSDRELTAQMKEIVGADIFDLSDLISKYETCDVDQITKNAHKLVIDTKEERGIRNQQIACDQIGISLDTLKSWNQLPQDNHGNKNEDYHKISLENLIKVLRWAEKAFEDVLN
jgi:predicted ATP-dependent endonuclease of OLD family